MNKIFASLLICWSVFAVTICDDSAVEECRSIHKTDVQSDGTEYENSHCLLVCNIHGKLWSHNMAEGQSCPALSSTSSVCKDGQCLVQQKLGWIDIAMTSATLSKRSMAFADVCIQNSSTPVSLPINDRSKCITCKTKVVSPTTDPQWDAVCTGSHDYLWREDTRITFQVYDQITSTQNNFEGGATLLISQLLANGDNHHTISLPLASGENSGRISVKVTWTEKDSFFSRLVQ